MLPEIVICICQGSEDIEAPPESSEERQLVARQQQLALSESIEAFDWISEMWHINAFVMARLSCTFVFFALFGFSCACSNLLSGCVEA